MEIIKRKEDASQENEMTTLVYSYFTVKFLSLCVAFNFCKVLNDMVAAFSCLHPKKIEVLCIKVPHGLV